MKNQFKYYIIVLLTILLGCSEDPHDYNIEYATGYPNKLAGVWVAYEFPNGIITQGNQGELYDLVTALDPSNPDSSLIIDNLYGSGLRVRVSIDSNNFAGVKRQQLEDINKLYGVESITIAGELVEGKEVDLDGFIQKEEDRLEFWAYLYDEFNAPIDILYIIAVRKTGFEESEF